MEIGRMFGNFVAVFAITAILQFVLSKIPLGKQRLLISYLIACTLGLCLQYVSAYAIHAFLIVGAALLGCMTLLYKRDVAKLNK